MDVTLIFHFKTFEDVLDSIANKNLALTVPTIGETFKLGEAEFEVIYTGTEKYGLNELVRNTDIRNGTSLVLL